MTSRAPEGAHLATRPIGSRVGRGLRLSRLLLALGIWSTYAAVFVVDAAAGGLHASAFILVPVALTTWWIGRAGMALSFVAASCLHLGAGWASGEVLGRTLGLWPVFLGMAVVGFVTLRLRRENLENHFRGRMLDAVDEAVVATDPAGTVLYWNPAAERLYGWSAEEAIGRDILTLTPTSLTAEQGATIMRALRRGETWSGGFQVRRKDGSTFDAWVSDIPITSGKGRVEAIIGVSRDLAPEKQRAARERLYQERQREMKRLIEVSRYKTEFLNSAAHELLTPLTPVNLQLDLLLAGKHGPLTDRQQSVIATLDRNIKALEYTLQEMVDAAHAQKAPVALRVERTDLAEEAAITAAHYAPLAARTGLILRVLASEPVVVEGDPFSLHKVVSALVDNAIRYSEAGGHVWIHVQALGDQAQVVVEDDGIGIPAEGADSVFEPFGRARREDARQGPGLGLYVARHLVEAHGGRIWFEHREGRGARFLFTIPLKWLDGGRSVPLRVATVESAEAMLS